MRYLIAPLLVLTACTASEEPSRRITLPTSPSPGPWSEMRSALDGCARVHNLTGNLEVRIGLGDRGRVISVNSAYGDAFATCVGRSLERTAYRGYAEQTLAVAFTPT